MNIDQILTDLKQERARLDHAIAALEGVTNSTGKRMPGRPPKAVAKKTGGITAAGRKRLSEAMKKRWAERRKKTGKSS